MADFKIIIPSDTNIIVHTVFPKFEAKLEGEDKDPKDWVGRIKWIDDVPKDEKANWRREVNEWYYQQTKDGLI